MIKKQHTLLLVSALIMIAVFLTGCQTAPKAAGPAEPPEDIEEVLSTVAGALSGKQLSEEEIRGLERQIRTDEEAQSAVQSITDSVGAKVPAVKYCPLAGERYAAHFEMCPVHNVKLEVVGQ